MARPRIGVILATAAALAACGLADTGCTDRGPLFIGVLLPVSAKQGGDTSKALAWALENVNAAGGVAGRRLELAWTDLSLEASATAAAERLAADPGVVAVIGPDSSRAVFEVAKPLIDAQKPFVSPSATSGDVFRAFAGTKLVWRTVESDIAQMQTMLAIARRDGAKTVAFLGSEDVYGITFFNWFGFFARELGLTVTRVVSYDQLIDRTCAPHVDEAALGGPDVVVAVPSDAASAACFGRAFASRPAHPRVLYSDTATDAAVLEDLGPLAEGMEGTIIVSDPSTGFDEAYRARTGEDAPPYAASAYDAVLLLAAGLERSQGAGGSRLASAMAEVVDARGAPTSFDQVGPMLESVRHGPLPNLQGALGSLDFDATYHTDLVASTYGRWVVRDGRQVIAERLSTGSARLDGTASIYRSFATRGRAEDPSNAGGHPLAPRTGLSALVVATTHGWDNYRHQADALAVYAALRGGGVTDDRLVLVTAGDLARHPRNHEPDVVRHIEGGPNLLHGAAVDYRLGQLRSSDLWTILRGERSARLPEVISTAPGDDLLVYLVGHGGVRGLDWQGDSADKAVLTPGDLADALAALRGRFRLALVVVDGCIAGVMADAIVDRGLTGVLVLTSSDRAGGSFATRYDFGLETWLADEFSAQLVGLVASDREASLLSAYRSLYLRVPGSHVSAYNASRFANLSDLPLATFFAR